MGGEKERGEEKLRRRPPPCHLVVWLRNLPPCCQFHHSCLDKKR